MTRSSTYPDPGRRLAATCTTCDLVIAGQRLGCKNFRDVLRRLKDHEDLQHPLYDKDRIIPALVIGVEEINGGNLSAHRVGRYAVYPFAVED